MHGKMRTTGFEIETNVNAFLLFLAFFFPDTVLKRQNALKLFYDGYTLEMHFFRLTSAYLSVTFLPKT